MLTTETRKTSQIGFAISTSSTRVHEQSVTYPDIAGLSIDRNKTSEELLGRMYTSLERRVLKALSGDDNH
jgi:hypothetical protein